ncbi:hypothetical protein [Actinomadura sp. NPDC049753]|uniref:hypothetical protein n=1 Tax=Actinomadura sp. NPDC049753 TaxID=3154739 RepID=UPI0034245276
MNILGPFTLEVKALHASGMTYQQMERKSKRVRSCVWFNDVANDHFVRPPLEHELGRFAELFGTSSHQVGLMVAEQWLGITYRTVSPVVRELEPILIALDGEDRQRIRDLAERLAQKSPSGKLPK